MNIPRYILPVSIAAAFHAALLWALPREDYVRLIPVVLRPVDPPPTKPENITPPEEKDPEEKPIQPLSGERTPPVLPDLTVTTKVDVLTMPVEARPINPTTDTRIIPTKIGPDGPGQPGPVDWRGTIFPGDQLDRTPNAKVQLPPEYPFAQKQAGIAGTVVVEFDVDRTGRVTAARVVRSSQREFEEPTLRAVRKWRFEPGRRNGVAVPFRLQVPVDFHLE